MTIKTAIREVDSMPEGVSPTVSLDKKKTIVEKRSQEVIEAVKKVKLCLCHKLRLDFTALALYNISSKF